MASIHYNKGAANWTASLTVWVADASHPRGGWLMRTRRSTGVPLSQPRKIAQRVADEMERIGNETRTEANPREFYERAVTRLIHAAGADGRVQMTRCWSEWAASWLAEQNADDGTIKKYKTDLARLTDFLGARASAPLAEITHNDLSAMFRDMKRNGLSSGTMTHAMRRLRACFQNAVDHGILSRNPCVLVKLEAQTQFARKPFTPEQIKTIFAHLRRHKLDEWRTACLFGLFYGMRINDALNRRGEEMADGLLTFVPKKTRRRKGSQITLPLIGDLVKLPRRGLLTPTLARMTNASREFCNILEDAGIDRGIVKGSGKGNAQSALSFHSWRHTANSRMSDSGADVRVRQMVSGHASAQMNAIYTHPALETMQRAIVAATKGLEIG